MPSPSKPQSTGSERRPVFGAKVLRGVAGTALAVLLVGAQAGPSLAASRTVGLSAMGPTVPSVVAAQVGFDLLDVIRALIRRGKASKGQNASRAIRVEGDFGRKARVQVVEEEGSGLVIVVWLEGGSERLLAHTFRVRADDLPLRELRILKHDVPSSRSDEEVVAAVLPGGMLDELADAAAIELELKGWERSFRAALDAKDIARIRSLRDKLDTRIDD